MRRLEDDPRLLRIFVWSTPFLAACWGIALVSYGRFIPPKSPSVSATTIAHFYLHHTTVLRIDTVIMMGTSAFWATWGVAIATFVKRMERGSLLTFVTVAMAGGAYVLFSCVAMFWGVAAFRPGEVSPQITLTLHDLGWFAFLFDAEPFSIFLVVIAVAILRDKSVPSVLPRWMAYANIWCAVLIFPASLIVFAKHGPIAYNGLVALYIPAVAFFAWIVAFSAGMDQMIKREWPASR
jgi:hypothetical protein